SHGFDISYSTSQTNISKKIETGYFPKKDENGNLQFSMYGDMVGSRTSQFAQPYTAEYIRKYLAPYANNNDPQVLIGTAKHLTDAMADATADFLANEKPRLGPDNPFFMYVAFNQVHVPIEPRPDLLAKYEQIETKDHRHTNKKYAAFIEQLDQVCARIIDQLKDPNGDGDSSDDISKNTIIIFASDNGGLGGKLSSNSPLRGHKGMQTEGGIRVPFIVYWPNHIQKGVQSKQILHAVDIYPTLAEIAGANLPSPKNHPLDGESFAPILFGKKSHLDRNGIFGHFPGYMDTRSVPSTYVIKSIDEDIYKMTYYYESKNYELYRISDDLGEANNLLEGEPKREVLSIAQPLRKDILKWLERMDPEPMTYRDSGAFVPVFPPIIVQE
ncbi:MAG: sulfatase-like hydrolase/transferase, partial [Bacteroidota bacterium]